MRDTLYLFHSLEIMKRHRKAISNFRHENDFPDDVRKGFVKQLLYNLL